MVQERVLSFVPSVLVLDGAQWYVISRHVHAASLTAEQHLGRAKDVSEFVKHGQSEATIEIELQRNAQLRMNPVLTRTIKRESNKSTYMINGQAKSGKTVMELAKSFNIQIDNLCQFLPQDRVVEFAQLSPVELLHSTQLAAASEEMIEHHEDLKKLRRRQQEVLGENKGDREQLANLENRQEMQRGDVERFQERAQIKKRLGWLESCRPVAQYQAAKKTADEAKTRQRQLEKELKDLHQEVGPALKRVDEKHKYAKHVESVKKERQRTLENAEKQVKNIVEKIEVQDTKMKEADTNYEAEKKGVKTKTDDQKRTRQVIARIQRQMEEEPEPFDPRAMNDEVNRKTARQRELENNMQDITDQGKTLRQQGLRKRADAEQAGQQIQALETENGRQENKLKEFSEETFTAWQWIKDNQDLFEKRVYGPPIVECSLKDPRYADAMESILQQNDFKIITAQTFNDFRTLQQRLPKLKTASGRFLHDFSLRQCSIDSLDQFRPPVSDEQLHQFGLERWALDCLSGPATVVAMLCNDKFLHQVGFASKDISQTQLDALMSSPISGCVAARTNYRFIRRREYGTAGQSANARPLNPAKHWTNQPVNEGEKARLQRIVNEARSDVAQIKSELREMGTQQKEMEAEKNGLVEEVKTLRADKDARQTAMSAFKALPARLTSHEDNLVQIEEAIAGAKARCRTIQGEKDTALILKSEATIQYAGFVTGLRALHQKLLEAEMMHIEAVSDFETLKSRNQEVHDMLEAKKLEEKEAQETSKKKITEARGLVVSCKALSDESRSLQAAGDDGLAKILQSITQSSGGPNALEADIDSEKARLEIMIGSGSEGMLREFEKRAKIIEELRGRLQAFSAQQEELVQVINEHRSHWEPVLDKLVERISEAFEESFRRIGCAGQVTVHKASSDDPEDGPDNGLDFANWSIHVSVKFRESEPLSLLDSHRQSGGERAVSTIFYLMALQSLSRAPFRVVDEINQGMDPRNERMVHGRMVDIACGDDSGSQYFLITPKLLSGLKYRKGMRVHCIVSGENMPDASREPEKKVDFAAWVQRARELGIGIGMKGTRKVDSGVHLGSSFEADDGVDGSPAPTEGGPDDLYGVSRSQSRVASVGA